MKNRPRSDAWRERTSAFGAGGEAHHLAQSFSLLLVDLGRRTEFHAVVVAAAVPDDPRRPNGIAGVGRSELNHDFVFRAQLHARKDQHAALADVVGAAIRDTGAVFA